MKKPLYTLLSMLLVGGLLAMAQIKPIKRQHSSKPKTEKTAKPKQSSSSNNSGKSKKTTKSSSQQSSSTLNAMSQDQKDQIIQQAIDDMVRVEGGTFTMGATREQGEDARENEKPAHQVTLSGFYISKYEVTTGLWLAVMGKIPDRHSVDDLRQPVEYVSWDDCQAFIRQLNTLTGKSFHLPTEAEWEYAARGGGNSHHYKYSGSSMVNDVAWNSHSSENRDYYNYRHFGSSKPVGMKNPNELGLYDMSGNVWEWCQDWYSSTYYGYSPQNSPAGPTGNYYDYRVCRGGCANVDDNCCRVSYRGGNKPREHYILVGLRLAM